MMLDSHADTPAQSPVAVVAEALDVVVVVAFTVMVTIDEGAVVALPEVVVIAIDVGAVVAFTEVVVVTIGVGAVVAFTEVVVVAIDEGVVVAFTEVVVVAFAEDVADEDPLDPVSADLTAWSYLPFAITHTLVSAPVHPKKAESGATHHRLGMHPRA